MTLSLLARFCRRLVSRSSRRDSLRPRRLQLTVEAFDPRIQPAVASVTLNAGVIAITSDSTATSVEVNTSSSKIVVQEVGTKHSWSFAASQVKSVQFTGGTDNDRFVDNVAGLASKAAGKDGDDWLVGNSGDDVLEGGAGNDHLNGMAGKDSLSGGAGNDTLIAIDNGYSDTLDGGSGKDTYWIDSSSKNADTITSSKSGDTVQAVKSFANGADRTLNGDDLVDPKPKSGATYQAFDNRPLFADGGPSAADPRQGALGDCWLLAGVSSMAVDNPDVLTRNMVDFDDGTYGVHLGDSFYRVDNELPTSSKNNPSYADLGKDGSLWVAVVEKAYAEYQTDENSYSSLAGGNAIDVYKAFGASVSGRSLGYYSSATSLANAILTQWSAGNAVSVGIEDAGSGVPLVGNHMYAVYSVQTNAAGKVTSITLRNPWGVDGGGNKDGSSDGLVTVTPAQLFSCVGDVVWGNF